VAKEVAAHTGPFPYVDGLILQVTQRIGSIDVRHEARKAGASGYTLRRLVRLWLSAWLIFPCCRCALRRCSIFPRGARRGRARVGGVAVVDRPRTALRLGLADGGAADFFRRATRAARADGRIHRPDVSRGEPTPAVGRARDRQERVGAPNIFSHRANFAVEGGFEIGDGLGRRCMAQVARVKTTRGARARGRLGAVGGDVFQIVAAP